ncbi:MAG: putative lipoprotein transmembrane [uncultured Ramlibacter sp.]|uniref:Putative lipoprotein transmembrane n=1 Tax=uncultured Ramlibacter sp. TaxID=260755 RepID=A0A6J4QAR6_9BURK|nr:MAG: putative lipoprotein transmembrane [uncultured Ramlibacter sp.]
MRKYLSSMSMLALLAACASNPFNAYDLQPGGTRQAVLDRLGNPTRSVAIPGGERLQYSLQPYGHFAWMVDLDSVGRVVRARQVLNANEFNRITPGQWTRADVEREFGPPARIDATSSWDGPIMTYRWRDVDRSDMFYWVYLDRNNVVQRAHQGMDFVNLPNERN